MNGTFSYSFDGERYVGTYETREEALAAGLAKARQSADGPQTVYVGRRVPANPMASGHARAILSHMTARAREQAGSDGNGYLANLSRNQIEDLDRTVETAILGWLTRSKLLPRHSHVESVSETPVPAPAAAPAKSGNDNVQVSVGNSLLGQLV
jgi:hypothetical protein